MVTVADIIGILEQFAPPSLAEPWDRIGLQIGDPARDVKRLYLALDPTVDVVEKAIAQGCSLLVTHHPLYLKAPNTFDTSRDIGKVIALACKHDLSIYAAHTNLDSTEHGLNDLLCDKLNLQNRRPLVPSEAKESCVKLVSFVPPSHTKIVLEALYAAGAGRIGEYQKCAFRNSGIGSFLAPPGAAPFIGKEGHYTETPEERIDVLVPIALREQVESALMRAHPYEEPPCDWIRLAPRATVKTGIGRVGTLAAPILLKDYVPQLKTLFKAPAFRVVGAVSTKIRTVAVCSGSGASLTGAAAKSGADLYITGDLKYHDALDAKAMGLAVADLGHFATEHWVVDLLAKMVQEHLYLKATAQHVKRKSLEIIKDRSQRDPFQYM